jgi:uncharacterized protein with HEPN domain
MLRRDVSVYLFDILRACDYIQGFTTEKSLEDYLSDPLLRSGVERQFEIIGEALNRATKTKPALMQEITAVAEIIAFRNRLIHGYATIDDRTVWGIVQTRLPLLQSEISALLRAYEMPEAT